MAKTTMKTSLRPKAKPGDLGGVRPKLSPVPKRASTPAAKPVSNKQDDINQTFKRSRETYNAIDAGVQKLKADDKVSADDPAYTGALKARSKQNTAFLKGMRNIGGYSKGGKVKK